MDHMPKIIVVVGPTASGKSDLAVDLALKFNGEVISADSRQVYKGLDIGSGKITKEEMKGILHHLLDVEDPKNVYSVQDFKRHSEKAIKEILNRGKLPIVAGGTGFYTDVLVNNIDLPKVPPDNELRKELENKSTEELLRELSSHDRNRSETVDQKNKRRLIRSIEIAKVLGNVPEATKNLKYNSLKIGIEIPKDKLKERIHERLLKRIDQGMIEEVENLHKNGLPFERLESLGLEYKYVAQYLQKKITKEEMVELLKTAIGQYAKRQMTWFKRDKKILWFKLEDLEKIKGKVREFLNN